MSDLQQKLEAGETGAARVRQIRDEVAQLHESAAYLAMAPKEEGADADWFRAQRDAYVNVLKLIDHLAALPVVTSPVRGDDAATTELLAALDALYPLPDDERRAERAGRTAFVLKRWIGRTTSMLEAQIPQLIERVRAALPVVSEEGRQQNDDDDHAR